MRKPNDDGANRTEVAAGDQFNPAALRRFAPCHALLVRSLAANGGVFGLDGGNDVGSAASGRR
jgi:hypothetical protein